MERDAGWTERAVRDAVLAGDVDAWRAWYDVHFEALARYARWRCGGLADLADDVIQETWLTAVSRLRAFDPAKGSFLVWLRGIAANAARNAIRGRARRLRHARSLEPGDDLHAVVDTVTTEKAERVAMALARLPEQYEAVLRAKYLEQLTVDEIASHRGESAKAVESLLTRARNAFRVAFESNTDE